MPLSFRLRATRFSLLPIGVIGLTLFVGLVEAEPLRVWQTVSGRRARSRSAYRGSGAVSLRDRLPAVEEFREAQAHGWNDLGKTRPPL